MSHDSANTNFIVKDNEIREDKKLDYLLKNEEADKPKTKKSKTYTKKRSIIGVDRKLITGIPGTRKYKGQFPKHNIKVKGYITICYVVDASGKVISAHRIKGLSGINVINTAVNMVKKYVKAEKANFNSRGKYTIRFK